MMRPEVERLDRASVRSPRRGQARTRAILDAALDLLGEVGYEQLTIDAIAARAGASKATIYRRWTDKRALVIDALEAHEASHPDMPGDSGSLRADLMALVELLRQVVASESSRVFLGLMYVSQHDPVIARAVRDQLVERRRADCRDVIQRAIGRGELPPHRPGDLLFDLLVGQIIVRSVLQGRELDDDYLAHLVDRVAIPVLEASAPPSERTE